MFSLEKRRVNGILSMCIKTWAGGVWNWEDGARVSSVVSSDWTRGKRHKLKYRTVHFKIRKNFFTVREVKC